MSVREAMVFISSVPCQYQASSLRKPPLETALLFLGNSSHIGRIPDNSGSEHYQEIGFLPRFGLGFEQVAKQRDVSEDRDLIRRYLHRAFE